MKSTDEPVVVEEAYRVPLATLWTAITMADQMRDWFFKEIEDFQPTLGFQTSFAIEHDGQDYTHCWEIIEVDPAKKIVYDWTYENTPGRGMVVWELEAVEGGTKLTMTNKAVESFPQDDPAFHRDSAVQGWEFLINDFLKEHLEPDEEDQS